MDALINTVEQGTEGATVENLYFSGVQEDAVSSAGRSALVENYKKHLEKKRNKKKVRVQEVRVKNGNVYVKGTYRKNGRTTQHEFEVDRNGIQNHKTKAVAGKGRKR